MLVSTSLDRPRARVLLLGALSLLLLAMLGQTAPATAYSSRPAPVGGDPFTAGQPYRGDFPDPTVWRAGSRFFAASTTVAALSLPITTSTDLKTWTTAPSSGADKATPYDGMPVPARWADIQTTRSGRQWAATWAPSVAPIVDRRTHRATWVAAYSVPDAAGHRCLSLARSSRPQGPFVDSSTGPLQCGPYGTIDPQLFVDGPRVWLLFKVEGSPDRIWVRRLTGSASGFAPSARAYPLLAPKLAWEGAVVENPAMFRFKKKLYLFYSGNGYGSTKYSTGYAICRKVTGPCKRVGRLLSSGASLSGTGGATPFLDRTKHLRLAYHAWTTGNVGYPATEACLTSSKGCAQRRLYIATLLRTGKKGHLAVSRYW